MTNSLEIFQVRSFQRLFVNIQLVYISGKQQHQQQSRCATGSRVIWDLIPLTASHNWWIRMRTAMLPCIITHTMIFYSNVYITEYFVVKLLNSLGFLKWEDCTTKLKMFCVLGKESTWLMITSINLSCWSNRVLIFVAVFPCSLHYVLLLLD